MANQLTIIKALREQQSIEKPHQEVNEEVEKIAAENKPDNDLRIHNTPKQYASNEYAGTKSDADKKEEAKIDYSKYGNGFTKGFIDELVSDVEFNSIINEYLAPNEGGYPTLISQELWEQCQKQKALNNHNGAGLKYSQKPFVLRGLITCGRTGRVCPCEDQLRRKYYSWVVCYTKTGQRRYIPEQNVLSMIETVLNRIKVPDSLINPLYEEIKNAEISEKQYCQQEIGKLRQEQEKLKAKLDNLFDLRLDGELDRETFETKRNEIQLKIDRMGRKIKTYEKTGNAFTSTILDLINLASQTGKVFAKSDNLELKHLLLKFVFKEMILTEGELTYELNFPFSEFEKAYFYEKRNKFLQGSQNEENQDLEDNKTDENAKSFGPKIAFKNQRVASKNATLLQSGWGGWIRTNECRHQKPMPYHLATPQHYSKKCPHKRTKVLLY